jgi:hypothetical protein
MDRDGWKHRLSSDPTSALFRPQSQICQMVSEVRRRDSTTGSDQHFLRTSGKICITFCDTLSPWHALFLFGLTMRYSER